MKHFIIKSFYLTTILLFSACHSTTNISGTYRSNFAIMGYFSTKIKVNSDSTFTYRMLGHMMYDTANGKYKINGNLLILNYAPKVIDTTLHSINNRNAILLSEGLINSGSRPHQFYLRTNKLFEADSSGHIFRREQVFSKHKKYLFWGSPYIKRKRYFLKRID